MIRNPSISAVCFGALAGLLSPCVAGGADAVTLAGLSGRVHVEVDNHGVPHVYAQSWTDAARVLGYLHATDRLWQMDMFRRQASGTTAEILGKQGLENDILMRQLGTRRTCEQMWASGDLPALFRTECEAYAAGVNAKIAELGEKNLPAMFAALGYRPEPWQPVDCLVFSKYMGWDQSGTADDLWFGMMVEKLGVAAAEELWPLERPYEVPTVKSQWTRPGKTARRELVPLPGAAGAYAAALEKLSRVELLGRGGSFGSNNWAVDGTKTASGKPILCNDPHLGFRLPSIWYTAHVSAAGKNVAGVTFPGSPVFVLGQNDHVGWGVTNMQTDAVDYFVETVDENDPPRYRHRGQWKKLERTSEKIPVRGESDHELLIDSTVHGPIVSRAGGRTIAMQWTGLKPTKDTVAFWKISRAGNLEAFLAACDDLTVPALNMVYADDAGTIAIYPCGEHPLRLGGQGRIPMDGATGENDWAGFVPRRELPLAVNPADHFVASANGRPQPLGYPHYLGWMWDPSYRIRRINDMLSKAEGLTVDSMQAIQLDAYDKAAERFVPVLLAAVASSSAGDPLVNRAAEELKKWDYVGDTDAIAPAIWLRWFDHYRRAVWNDEWASRGIEQPGGSWGFSGDNKREPMLEVLEYITREFPDSVWFDDRATQKREARDEIMRRSFAAAVKSLADEFGDDPEKWRWGNLNTLRIGALSGQPELARTGGPIVGTSFTVNPGGDTGPVGGGASWRQIIDLADTARSVGVYPGGQSENPASPLYADQMPLWAHGEYLPINMIARAKLAAEARAKSLEFAP
ncbi:MAG: penicillin acylase family protein [Pirellulales bacterium]